MNVDVSAARSPEELHTLLAKAFGFPDYYGQNWDAFDECIRDVPVPDTVEISGIEKLRSRLPRDAKLLHQCLSGFAEESHDPKVTIHFI
jgi:RNAse (barnase) inhibitor barstar